MPRDPVLVAGMADADPDAAELARAQAGVGAAQPVVSGDAATQLDPDLARRKVELVVEDDEVRERSFMNRTASAIERPTYS